MEVFTNNWNSRKYQIGYALSGGFIKGFAHSTDKADRKFQSLTLVYTHYIYCIFIFTHKFCFPKVHIILLQLINVSIK